MRLAIALLCVMVTSANLFAQDDEEVVFQPVQVVVGQALGGIQIQAGQFGPMPGRQPRLDDVIKAKVTETDGVQQVIFLAESYRDEVKLGQVTKFKQETRSREVLDGNGKTVTQDYTVTIPYTEEGEVTTRVPAGKKPHTVAASECKFFNLNSEELTGEEATKLLSELKTVLLLDNTDGRPVELDPLMREVLKPELLIIVTKAVVREAPHWNGGMQLDLALPAQAAVPVLPAFRAVPAVPPVPAPPGER